VRSTILDSAMGPVVIVLFDPASNRRSRFLQIAILGRPDFFFLQAAMKAFDGTVVRAGAKIPIVPVEKSPPLAW